MTDRGRILLQFGNPERRTVHKGSFEDPASELWEYDSPLARFTCMMPSYKQDRGLCLICGSVVADFYRPYLPPFDRLSYRDEVRNILMLAL